MSAGTLDRTAREAVASACQDVSDPHEDGRDDVDGVRPGLVARPGDTEQVAEVLRAAAAHGLTVVPRGHGTKMTWGLPPTSADVLVDVSALDGVLDHAAGDLIVAARAGTRLADVQQTVGEAGQRLAIDETVPGASIGGVLAANTSGPRRVATRHPPPTSNSRNIAAASGTRFCTVMPPTSWAQHPMRRASDFRFAGWRERSGN